MDDALEIATTALKHGQTVIFPTDTQWGIGVAVEYCPAPDALFAAKERSSDKPVAWLVASVEDLKTYGEDVPAYAVELARQHWPGALTLVVKASSRVPESYRSKAATIGLRVADAGVPRSLIEAVGCPLATTSANRSGAPGVSAAETPDAAFLARAGAVVYDPRGLCGEGDREKKVADEVGDHSYGGCLSDDRSFEDERREASDSTSSASTVVDCTGAAPKVLRQGPVLI